MPNISPMSIVEDGAQIEDNVIIGPFCKISKDATIKSGTILAEGVMIKGKVTIGKNNKIESYAVIGGTPQALAYKDEPVEVIIGDGNTIREFVTINGGMPNFTKKTVIGNNNFIMAYVHIAHDCRLGDNNVLANGVTFAGHIELGSRATIGGLTPIHQFVKIGSYCMIGGASAVSQDIPPYCLAEGNRAKIRGINKIGIRRNLDRDVADALSHTFKELSYTEEPIKEKAKKIMETSQNEHVKLFCAFIIDSTRGVPITRRHNES